MPDVDRVLTRLRAQVAAEIARDPVQVTIHRVQQVPDGSGGYLAPIITDLAPFEGRLRASRLMQTRATATGTVQVYGWSLLAPYTADIKRTALITDTFTLADGRVFEVIQVKPLRYAGQTFGIEAECTESQ